MENSVLYSNGRPRFEKQDEKNTAKIPIWTFMINGTMNIMHGNKHIEFNPSAAPSALGIAFNPGYYYSINIQSFSKDLLGYTDNQLPGLAINAGVDKKLSRSWVC